MPLDDAFWQDILEHPDDDAPRLIYADWLSEQTDEESRALAEFIRVQMELEQPPEEGPCLWALRQREAELLRGYRGSWVGPLRDQVLGEGFRRGFVESVTLGPEHFIERADAIFSLAPVRELCLRGATRRGEAGVDPEGLLPGICASGYLRQLTRLRLHFPLSMDSVVVLAACPHFTCLTDLEVCCPEITCEGLRILLNAPATAKLRRLWLESREIEAGALQVLAGCPALAGLVELVIKTVNPSAEDVGALASSPHLGNLKKLDLGHNRLGPAAVTALAGGPLVTGLQELVLAGNALGDAAMEMWTARSHMPHLHRLDLRSNRLQARSAEALAHWLSLAGVTFLDLRNNITGAGLATLANSPWTEQLRVLLLHFNGIDDNALSALARSDCLPELIWLDLRTNRITDRGGRALANSPWLQHLARLEMARNDLGAQTQADLVCRFGARVSL